MGKKGSWFSAIKRVFIPNSKDKPVDGLEKKSTKEKKRGILRHGDAKSLVPLFREPSSIEKILAEVDQQNLLIRPPAPVEEPTPPPLVLSRAASPRATSCKDASLRVASPRAASSRALQHHKEISYRPELTLRYCNISATKIQAAYRGYMDHESWNEESHQERTDSSRFDEAYICCLCCLLSTLSAVYITGEHYDLSSFDLNNRGGVRVKARRGFRALRGLVRLQGAVRGQNVKRQTMNAIKMMQLLVRVQTQIQSRRIQMSENQAIQCQAYKNDKESESTLGKWTAGQSVSGLTEDWDDSVLTREEVEARLQRKVEATIKRERTMAYSYSHQLWKANPKSAPTSLMDIRAGGFPWGWNWLDRQLPPPANPPESQTTIKSFQLTPPRPKPSPGPASFNYKQHNIVIGFDNLESLTPRSSKSAVPMRTKYQYTPLNRTPKNNSFLMKYSKPKTSAANSAFDFPLKDNDSRTSCPPFSVPNYMTPTVSAKAKARESNNILKDVFPGTPGGDSSSKKRFSFTLTPNLRSFKWKKGSSKDSNSQKVFEKRKSLHSIGDVSIDSAISMPAAVGRKPFNRFV